MKKVLLIIIGLLIVFLSGILYLNWPTKEVKEETKEEPVVTSFNFTSSNCETIDNYFCVKTISDVSIGGVTKDLVLKITKSADYLVGSSSVTDLTMGLYWDDILVYTFKPNTYLALELTNYEADIKIDVLDNRYLVIGYIATNNTLVDEKVLDVVDITNKQVVASLGLGSLEINTLSNIEFSGSYYKITDNKLIYYSYECNQAEPGNYFLREISGTFNNGILEKETLTEYTNINSTTTSISC